MSREIAESIERDGYSIVKGLVSEDEAEVIAGEFSTPPRAGLRGALARSERASRFIQNERLALILDNVVGRGWSPVRSILFDKRPDANWLVPKHRDTTIAIEQRIDVPGFGPWSVKDGVTHVRPPDAVLEAMLTVRLSLDLADSENGALLVWPGSHRLPDHESDGIEPVVCETYPGDVVLMRPRIMHASRKATSSNRRRVLHIETTSTELPGGLQWADA